jgi:hypothetical protein
VTFISGEAETRLDDLIKSLQKGSADLMKGEDLQKQSKLSTFKQNETELMKGKLKFTLSNFGHVLKSIFILAY